MKRLIAGAYCAAILCLAASPAAATSFAGNLSGSYANFSNGGGDAWSVDGAAAATLDGGWGGEATAGYHHLSVGGWADLGNVGGSLFWGDADVRIAANVNYLDLSLFHLTTYGAGGEWYALPELTVSARGGGASGQFGIDGGYVGGDVKWYPMPDLSLNAGVDYINLSGFDHVTSEDIRAEWLVSETTPISVYGGYGHAESSGGSQDIFFIGIKIYTNDDGAKSLVERQRGGNL